MSYWDEDETFGLDAFYERDDDVSYEVREDYCDLCEREGHTFRSCPRRDDE